MVLVPASFVCEREDRSSNRILHTLEGLALRRYSRVAGAFKSTSCTVVSDNNDLLGIPRAVTIGHCAAVLQPTMATPVSRRDGSSRGGKARPQTGSDHVKHRRTRSGCWTCRKRRVKCDEARPKCIRCRKGGRECVFPSDMAKGAGASETTKNKTTSPGQDRPSRATASDLDAESELEEASGEPHDSVHDDSHDNRLPFRGRQRERARKAFLERLQDSSSRSESQTPSCASSQSYSPSETSEPDTVETRQPPPPPQTETVWGPENVDERVRFYLNYFVCHITFLDYGLTCDPDSFFDTTLLQMAMLDENRALLYGIVAFSAYHHALKTPEGGLEDFLEYYNNSVASVLQTLNSSEEPGVSTAVTLLQLNAIEANFSDFPQLVSHHRAAGELILRNCGPEMVGNLSARTALLWYLHCDSLMSSWCKMTRVIPRDYVETLADFYRQQGEVHPKTTGWNIAASHVQLYLASSSVADSQERQELGHTPNMDSNENHALTSSRLHEWHGDLDSSLLDTAHLALGKHDLASPDGTAVLEPWHQSTDASLSTLFGTTLLLAYWHFAMLLHEGTNCLSRGQQPPESVVEHAVRICQIWSFATSLRSASSCMPLIAPLRVAILFLPRNGHYSGWIRRNLAMTETLGNMMAQPVRACMAQILQDQTCLHWWLSNEENMTMAVRNARAMADERWAASLSSTTTTAEFRNSSNTLLEIADAIIRVDGASQGLPLRRFH
ncbi:uncharacterized protein B0I36DRAFT_322792 [Microdochium trichocladiopsis]|uniref:Zn(2)-C6 fungal-type domain-containing protein n=1 Tax=Microdochium trichocladiopsis TaxID=1682393 RepID=A0A9P8Y6M1_9PEZI|nr:uncharacterized protein B0I36DRAFT_322792 [Microdochium trichocladiopsis]KAH7030927.1 hypothetical protein B0I36DRAFT_322792 [Microdochium trichocladiopsis]